MTMMKARRRMRIKSSCSVLCFLCVLMFHSYNVYGQEPTPSPVRIPDTVPPSPTPPPPTTEAPVPTEAPPTTEPPVPILTSPPTEAPVPPPTPDPTVSPTDAPTVPPTASPTVSPTPAPITDAPTVAPTLTPSVMPSVAPSPFPSAVIEPSAEPSISPAPTFSASEQPSIGPTLVPSEPGSPAPSSVPSFAPTLEMQDVPLVEVFMTFDNMSKMQGRTIVTFETITKNFVEKELANTADPTMQDLTVWANYNRQQTVSWPSSRRRRLNHVRVLQQSRALLIVFDTSVEYRSVGTDHDVPKLVGETWATQEDQDAFIAALKASGDDTFQDITRMKTEINGWDPGSGGNGGKQDTDLFIIIGASVGGAALLFLIGLGFVMLRRRDRPKKEAVKTSNLTFATPQPPSSNGDARVSTEIVVDQYQDDVSTLGDPMFGAVVGPGGISPGLEKDETVAPSSFDYEYAKSYGMAAEETPLSVGTTSISKRTGLLSGSEQSSALDLGQMEDQFFSDDESFEEQFQEDGEILINVMAPAGKLGMVIDTPSGGVPIVHAIKETSILASQVRVGDRLLSVDGVDCTGMTAMNVSKLISQRAQNASRAFVFSRSRARLMSKDD